MDLALDFYNIWLIQADPRWSQHRHQDNWFNICCIYIYIILTISIWIYEHQIHISNQYQYTMRHLFGSVLVKRSKIIVRYCTLLSESHFTENLPRNERSKYALAIMAAWLLRFPFISSNPGGLVVAMHVQSICFFFSCFFFAQRHHIQIAQAVNSMAFSWHPDLNEVCVTCWNRIVRAMFLPCLSCVMTAQKNEVPYRLELLIPWLGLFHILLAWLEEKVSLWLHGLNK